MVTSRFSCKVLSLDELDSLVEFSLSPLEEPISQAELATGEGNQFCLYEETIPKKGSRPKITLAD